MNINLRKIRNYSNLTVALLFSWLYLPHILAFISVGG